MSNYWKDRIEQQRLAALHRTVKQTDKELLVLYQRQQNNLYDELLRVLVSIQGVLIRHLRLFLVKLRLVKLRNLRRRAL